MAQSRNSFADRLFRLLLRFFPPEFRGDYGRDMEATFLAQRREIQGREFEHHKSSRRQKAGLLRLWAETIADIFRTAPAEHLEMFRQDGGYALRMMRQSVGFSCVVVAILALGIGANTAIFSVVNGVLLRPLPYASGDRLVVLSQQAPRLGYEGVRFSVPEIDDYRAQSRTLETLVEYHSMDFDLIGEGEPRRVTTGVVSANFFDTLGVKPLLGRTFLPADDQPGAPAVLVFSYEYWQQNFGGDRSIIGRQFRMNDRVHTAIGVLPPIPQYPDTNDVYMSVSACPFRANAARRYDRSEHMMLVFGRLRESITPALAQQELSAIASGLAQKYPQNYPKDSGYDVRLQPLRTSLTQRARPVLLILFATAGFVLLIACANIANLSLSRQLSRERELAIRTAVGASRSRVLRQMVTETTMLSLVGGIFGIGIAYIAIHPLISFAEKFTPRAHEITIDSRVLLFSFALSLITGVLFGSIPAMVSPMNLADPLRQGASKGITPKSRRRLRDALVVAQVALSLALLVGAGLTIRSFYKLTQVDPGFRSQDVVSMLIDLDWKRYSDSDTGAANRRTFQRKLLEKAASHPGVIAAALGTTLPLYDTAEKLHGAKIEGREPVPGEPEIALGINLVTPDYFRALGISLLRGRYLSADDGPKDHVAVVSRSLAEHYWPNQDPIGRHISLDDGEPRTTIVGVVADVRENGLDQAPDDEIYLSQALRSRRGARLIVRTQEDPTAMIRDLVADVYQLDPTQPVAQIRTLEQVRQQALAPPRLISTLLGSFALLALIITAAGIQGVMGLTVSQRIKEIGIRIALGATRGAVLRMILLHGLLLVGTGVAFGLAVSYGGTRLIGAMALSGLLFGVQPNDSLTIFSVSLLLLLVAAAACYGPVRRAIAVDPMETLRAE
jgi:putative ABC transport system permease protein